MKKADKQLEFSAYYPVQLTLDTAAAFQALARGEANPQQQKALVNWLLDDVCRTYDMEWRPEGERESSFAAGRRFVGLQLVKFLKVNLNILKRKTHD